MVSNRFCVGGTSPMREEGVEGSCVTHRLSILQCEKQVMIKKKSEKHEHTHTRKG